LVIKKLNLPAKTINMTQWTELLTNIKASKEIVKIGMIGKYNDLEDAYLSLNE